MKIHCIHPGLWVATSDHRPGVSIYVTHEQYGWFIEDVDRRFKTVKAAMEYIKRVCFGE